MEASGLKVETETCERKDRNIIFLKVTADFSLLEKSAERLRLEMPVRGLEEDTENSGCCFQLRKRFTTDDEQDVIATEYDRNYRSIFLGIEDEKTFFRSSVRQMLVWDTLTRIDITHAVLASDNPDGAAQFEAVDIEEGSFVGMLLLMHKHVLEDAFVPHDPVQPDESDARSQISRATKSCLK